MFVSRKLCRGLKTMQLVSYNHFSNRNVNSTLEELESKFSRAGIPDSKSSARHLIAAVFNQTNLDHFLSTCKDLQLDDKQVTLIDRYTECRLARMPVQYIVGTWDFLGLTLEVRPPVFIPRPETEELVQLVVKHLKAEPCLENFNVLEIGCGSGAISLALANEFRDLKITCFDQSKMACDLTIRNATRLKLDDQVHVLQAKLTENCLDQSDTFLPNILLEQIDVIVSNPPYVLRKDLTSLQPEITMFEDLRALDGGSDGLTVINSILRWSSKVLKPGGHIFLEVDPCHPFLLPDLISDIKKDIESFSIEVISVEKDFCDKDRFIELKKMIRNRSS